MALEEQTKKEVLNRFITDVGKMSIMVFKGLDLKTHIDAMIIDEDTSEEYVITINKVSNGQLFKDGGIVFTKKQKEDFAIEFKIWCENFEFGNPKNEKTTKQLLEIYKQTL